MKKIILAALFLAGCDQKPPPTQSVPVPEQQQQSQPQPLQPSQSSGGMLEHMAGAAVAGASAGAAGAVAHRATNHVIDKMRVRKRARAISKMRSRKR